MENKTRWQQQAFELFGDPWKATLARLLQCDKRAVQRWASEFHEHDCPDEIKKKIETTRRIWIQE